MQFCFTAETEVLRGELAKVRAELEPWEKQLIDHRGKLEVALSEKKLLNQKVRTNIQSLPFSFMWLQLLVTHLVSLLLAHITNFLAS